MSGHISAIKQLAPGFEALDDFARFVVAFVHWSLNDTASRRNQGRRNLILKIPVISSPNLPELIWMGWVGICGGLGWGIVANGRRLSRRLIGANCLFGYF